MTGPSCRGAVELNSVVTAVVAAGNKNRFFAQLLLFFLRPNTPAMIGSRIPPPPPPSSTKPNQTRSLSQIYALAPSSPPKNNQRGEIPSPAGSNSLTPRSYRQPAGKAQLERSASAVQGYSASGSGGGGGSVGGLAPRNTWSGVSRSAAASTLSRSTSGPLRTGRKRNVFCDVVLEQSRNTLEGSVEQSELEVLV